MTDSHPKILFVLNRLNIGGMEKRVERLAAALRRAGWAVGLLCLTEGGPLEAMAREAGLRVDILDYRGIRAAGPGGVWRTIRAGRAIVRDFQPDVVQAFLPTGNMFANIIAGAAPRARFAAGKVTTGFYYRRGPLYGLIENWTLRRAAVVYCNGGNIRRELVETCGVSESRVRVIHNGIDAPPPAAAEERRLARIAWRERLGLPAEAVLIGMVANLFGYKGHRFAVEAAVEIVARHPAAHFVFAGRDEGEREPLLRQARALGIAGHVHLPGAVEDVRGLLLALDAALSSSQVEGFSNVWLESMATELPCVFTRVGAAGEAFEDGRDCLLVPAGDAGAISAALLRILGDPALAAQLARQGREKVLKDFIFAAMTRSFMDMYHALAVGPPRH